MTLPTRLVQSCQATAERREWLDRLPESIHDLKQHWHLTLDEPFDGPDVSCAWVAPGTRSDGTPVVLKLGMPHFEGDDEINGLRFWNGDPTVQLLDADEQFNAMLLERCEPGTSLRQLPESQQDTVIAGLLRRLWRPPDDSRQFRPLSQMIDYWCSETRADEAHWPDAGLVREGLAAFGELSRSAPDDVPLATDLHAGNVLRAEREPWLVIDPKPFVGDRSYDATQHLLNCRARLRSDPQSTIERFSDLLEVDSERVRLWLFARAAAEPREEWEGELLELAWDLSP